ncbi:hypothetical protein [Parasitella parasitica]|uniref:Exosome complex protein n=1 Tax=Parasitella parasitica TaxID=35722 RepID=A0A0B7MYV6_9FUNG|nr:hypothetical protein [Parasitella parasitica]
MEAPSIDIPKKAVRALKTRLQVVKKHLEPILSRPISDGSDPQKHEVMSELVRVQQYIQKLKKAQGKQAKPTMKVDKEAAARFIKSAINEGAAENDKAVQEKKRKLEEDVSISSDDDDEEQEGNTKKKDAFSNHSSEFSSIFVYM